ncbi:MAG: hypothetical protein F6J89_22370 [Symploca sp. SIO1C4]|uniref:Uncharacterized protein n=1 Tax=Symploca sp. SIO1C4 TaxID=2607765 RepID=A0A6B3NIA5_9CYAN|nr:hypothetical protein [Symploca sp. SIO1C4]NET04452.1 hypothetical protein [Symploca sp. SIO2B6]
MANSVSLNGKREHQLKLLAIEVYSRGCGRVSAFKRQWILQGFMPKNQL